jgi:RHS repeat-associated protein
VLTEEQQTDAYPAASMETAQAATENQYYANIDATRTAKPSGYPSDSYTNPNDYVAKVRGDGNKIGPSMVLKVMAGDRFNLRVNSWWNSGSSPGAPASPLNDLISALSNGLAGVDGGKATATELTSTGVSNAAATGFLNSQTYNSNKPKAFVNWVFLDEQFKYYGGGFEQVGASNTFTTHTRNNVLIPKNGYLYVYVSNETTNIDVFFDNLQVTHIRGPLLEETQYYPFGLTMAGISSRALNNAPENKKKFIGQLLDDDLGLNWYQFRYRNHDPQIGRFVQVDPLATKYVYNSTYAYAENKVGMGFDLEGLELQGFNEMFRAAGINVEQANRTTQAVATNLAKKAEPVINVTKDVITIAGGVTLLVASGGTAAPILVGLAGSATVAGGTMKLAFDISGNKEAADQIPTTLSGTAIFLTNGASEAATGKKLISDDVKTVAEFSEGVLTFKVSGFDKMSDVEKASTILSGLSLTLDGVNPETAKAFQNLLGTMTGGGNGTPIKLDDNKAKVDNTYVKPPIILPVKN